MDIDDPFVEDTRPILATDDELRNHLMLVPHSEDYDEWIKVGMALYHQYDGEETGLQLWHLLMCHNCAQLPFRPIVPCSASERIGTGAGPGSWR